jgi:hypothetical protein
VEPATIGAITAILGLLYQYGPWGVSVVVLWVVLGVWRTGEFLPKSTHDTIVAATTQRYIDLLDRFNGQQEAIKLWREQAERAIKTTEIAQTQHAELFTRLADLQRDVQEVHEDIRSTLLDNGTTPRPSARRPGPAGRG